MSITLHIEKKHLHVISILLFFVVVPSFSLSQFPFTGFVIAFQTSCNPDNTIYKLFDSGSSGSPYNSHVAIWNSVDPVYTVSACSTVSVVHDACGGTLDGNSQQVVFWLYSSVNSHASQNNQPGLVGPGTIYNIPVCYNNKYCLYGSYGSDCNGAPSEYECVGSLSAAYNAHVGDCNEYTTKICCGDTPPPCGNGVIDWASGEQCDVGPTINPLDDIFPDSVTSCQDLNKVNTPGLFCDSTCRFSGCGTSNPADCGNGVLDSNEPCDGNLFYNDLTSCESLDNLLEGNIECTSSCDLDLIYCRYKPAQCIDCDDCGFGPAWLGIGCSQNICVNFCPERSSCYFRNQVLDVCASCGSVYSCSDFTNEQDCVADVCALLTRSTPCPGADCRVENEIGYKCIWEGNRCVPDHTCQWDCSGLYGPCQGDGFKYRSSLGSTRTNCVLIQDLSSDTVFCQDPTVNYPDRLACNFFEREFPIFTWFNIVFTFIFLISYYSIINIKKKRKMIY